MRALNFFQLLSLAIVLVNGEASDAVKPEGKKQSKEERELQSYYDWGYYGGGGYDHITAEPTSRPTHKPSPHPSPRPTPHPTGKPSPMPTHYPSPRPTPHPTPQPSQRPTKRPTAAPIPHPTRVPTPNPTPEPTPRPTIHPTPRPTTSPTCEPSPTPSERPTHNPTAFPTARPSNPPTLRPTSKPTQKPTGQGPSSEPSENPTMSEEPSENPTISDEPTAGPTFVSSLSGSSTLSFAGGCNGAETILDIVCAARNSNVLGSLCDEIEERNLEELLSDCNRRLTLFAPTNSAFDVFFDRFNNAFFDDEDNFPFNPVGDIVLDDAMTTGMSVRLAGNNAETTERIPLLDDRGGRKLIDEEFKTEFMTAILNYHIAEQPLKQNDLECDGFIRMKQRGFSATVCTAFGEPKAQEGTCNAFEPQFDQVDIPAANGYIQIVTGVMIPSPNGEVTECNLIGP